MSRASRVLPIIGLVLVCVSFALAGGSDPFVTSDVQQNLPRDPGDGGPSDPGGGLCPDPWPVTVTISGFNSQGVHVHSANGSTHRSVTRVPNKNFRAVICADDTVAWEAASVEGPGLRITNNHTAVLHIEWTYVDGSRSGVVAIPPGASVFHSLTGDLNGIELLDPGPDETPV